MNRQHRRRKPAPDIATVQALRADMALQISRHLTRRGLSQVQASRKFDVPRRTLQRIVNGRVAGLSLELLIRIAVRAQLSVVMQTGTAPEEAGVFLPARSAVPSVRRRVPSKVADEARDASMEAVLTLSPEQRLNAMLEHSQLVAELHAAGKMLRHPRA